MKGSPVVVWPVTVAEVSDWVTVSMAWLKRTLKPS